MYEGYIDLINILLPVPIDLVRNVHDCHQIYIYGSIFRYKSRCDDPTINCYTCLTDRIMRSVYPYPDLVRVKCSSIHYLYFQKDMDLTDRYAKGGDPSPEGECGMIRYGRGI